MALKFDIVTLFPDFFDSPLRQSLLAKSLENGRVKVNLVNLRDFSGLPHHQVDDRPYGGGAGMVLRADILAKAVKTLKTPHSQVILLDPSGTPLQQKLASQLALAKHLILVCGRYEGVDQRFIDQYVDLSISIGDYVLNGGEVASLVLLEAIARLQAGFVGNRSSLEAESFQTQETSQGKLQLLDYPHYTRPEKFEELSVPEVLTSGDHQKIASWRQQKSLELTKKLRPDLLAKK